MQELIQEAIDFMQAHEPPEGYFVGFSGGKDSIVTLDLVRQSRVKHQAYYSMTLIDPPEVVRFIKQYYPDVTCLKPKMTFWQGCMKKGMPLMYRRWCCDVLKKQPSVGIPLKQRIMGIRAEESSNRAKRGRISKLKKWVFYKPIFHWSSEEIWEYIKYFNLEYCCLYDEGFARIGCIVCPFLTSKKMVTHRKQWPAMYKILDIYLNKVWELGKFDKKTFTYEEFMSWPNWKTKEQRKQLNMIYEKSGKGET